MYIDEAKEMAITSPTNLSDTLKSHRRTVLIAKQHEDSLRPGAPIHLLTETEIVNKQLEDNMDSFETCHCGYEEGRSEADMLEHREHCAADGDKVWDSFRDTATDAEMDAFEQENRS